MTGRPRVGISRCLLGDHVRYDGGSKYEPSLVEDLSAHVEWIPICPELEAGMGVPREPVHLVARGGAVQMVGAESGRDWTGMMHAWALARLAALREIDVSGFVLKSASPSCGVRDVPIVGAQRARGLFAEELIAAMPGLPVEDEVRLRDPAIRAEFLRRVMEQRRG